MEMRKTDTILFVWTNDTYTWICIVFDIDIRNNTHRDIYILKYYQIINYTQIRSIEIVVQIQIEIGTST